MFINRFSFFAFLTGTVLLLTSCNVSDSDNDHDNSDAKSVVVQMHLHTATSSAFKAVNVDSLTEIKLLVEELELESINDDLSDFEVEDLVVNLPLNGDSIQLITKEIPAGIYDEFEMEIEHDDDGSSISDPDFFDSDEEYSIVVKGIYNGEAFTFRTEEDFEIELDLNPPLEITETTTSAAINVSIDPSTWFVDAQGDPLDPNDPANFNQIEDNIENSFEAEGDDDDDDDDDDD